MKFEWSSLRTYLGIVTILALYINTNPDVMDKLHFAQSLKDWTWEITRFVMWLGAAGYIASSHPNKPA